MLDIKTVCRIARHSL